MNRALVVPIIAIILTMLAAAHVNSYNSVTPSNTPVALAKTSGSVKSSSPSPTLSECSGKAGNPVALTFLSACLVLYPHHFKKGEGGTLVIVTPDSTEGLKPFGNKK